MYIVFKYQRRNVHLHDAVGVSNREAFAKRCVHEYEI